jgi:hypothetical protein
MPTRSRERRGPFGLQGRRTEGVAWATACPTAVHRRRVKRARYWGVRNYAEAAALGIPELLLQTHAPVIQGHRVCEGVGQIGRQPPGFFLPWGPDPEDPDPDGLVLPEVDRLPGVEEPALVGSSATRRTTNDGFRSSRSWNPETR